MNELFNIGDRVSYASIRGTETGVIEEDMLGEYLVRLPSGKVVICNETSLTKIQS